MHMMLKVDVPLEPRNALIRDGEMGELIKEVMDDVQPEMVFFSEEDGTPTTYVLVSIEDGSEIPSVTEPFFLKLNAKVEIHPGMTTEEIMSADLDALGQKWG